MMIFSGSSNLPLATSIAKKLNTKLGGIELSRFANNEARVRVTESKVPKEVVVIQSLSKPTDHHLIEFGLICDALKRVGATDITAVIPWLGYSKQDRVFREGEPLSVKVIASMIQSVNISKIITFDLHNPAILGFFDVPVINLSAMPLLVNHFRSTPGLDNTLVIAPDAGAVKASSAFAKNLGVSVAYIDKDRDLATGQITVRGLSQVVRDKDIIIVDDMIVTGNTLLKTVDYLKEHGAKSIKVGVTHHLYVPGTQGKIDSSQIDSIIATDSIATVEQSEKLTILSLDNLIASELK